MAYKEEEHILLLTFKVMDNPNFLPGEALFRVYPERYSRLQDTVGGLLSYRYDSLQKLLRPVRDYLVLNDVFLNNWMEFNGFYVRDALVIPQVVVDAVRRENIADAVSCSTLALDVSDHDGIAGRLAFSRGLGPDEETRYWTSQLQLYPDYRHAVEVITTNTSWHRSERPNGTEISSQAGVPSADLAKFAQFHRAIHSVLPNILDIPLQQRILSRELL